MSERDFLCRRMIGAALAVALASGGIVTAACAQATFADKGAQTLAIAGQPEPPRLDLSKNPGCGVKGLNRAQKIERNRKIAQMYYQSYVEAPHTRKLTGWDIHGCLADNAVIVPGTFPPYGTRIQIPPPKPGEPNDGGLGLKEMQAYWITIPDLGVVPGTFVVYAWEGGAFFRHLMAGHANTGRYITLWEVEFILVNDEGKITLWEFWGDTQGAADLIKTGFGADMKDLNVADYGTLIYKILGEKGDQVPKTGIPEPTPAPK